MDIRQPFRTWYDPTVMCVSVWDGTGRERYLLATKDDVSWGSSLGGDAPSQQPSKPSGTRGSKRPNAARVGA